MWLCRCIVERTTDHKCSSLAVHIEAVGRARKHQEDDRRWWWKGLNNQAEEDEEKDEEYELRSRRCIADKIDGEVQCCV